MILHVPGADRFWRDHPRSFRPVTALTGQSGLATGMVRPAIDVLRAGGPAADRARPGPSRSAKPPLKASGRESGLGGLPCRAWDHGAEPSALPRLCAVPTLVLSLLNRTSFCCHATLRGKITDIDVRALESISQPICETGRLLPKVQAPRRTAVLACPMR